jgi:hypothetical protein
MALHPQTASALCALYTGVRVCRHVLRKTTLPSRFGHILFKVIRFIGS